MKFYFIIILLLSFNQTTYAQMSNKEANEIIMTVAEMYSENLPMEIDKATTLIGIFAGLDRDIVYKYSLKVKPSVLEDEEVRDYFTKGLSEYVLKREINNYCSQPGLKIFKDNNITIEHNFVDINNRYLFDVRILSKDC